MVILKLKKSKYNLLLPISVISQKIKINETN